MLFRVLGPLEIQLAQDDVGAAVAGIAIAARKPRTLLTNLLLQANSWVGVDELVDELWPRGQPASARRNVKTYVWQLRRLLPPHPDGESRVESGAGGYRVRADRTELDSWVFERHARAAAQAIQEDHPRRAVAEATSALALWRGRPFECLQSESATPECQRLIELKHGVHADLATAQLAVGDITAAVSTLRAITAQQPLRESSWCQLIGALDTLGRRAEAMTVYRQASSVLATELGVAPGPELTALRDRMTVRAPQPATQGRRNFLPRDLADFTGRVAELAGLLAVSDRKPVRCGQSAMIEAVDGMAGIGKTALVVRAAALRKADYPDAQLFLDLHGHSPLREPLTASAALDILLRMLGVPGERITEGVEEKAALWRAELADLRAIVVLDNAVDSGQVRPLLPNGPGSLILITSRRRLIGLDGVRSHSLEVLGNDEAVELFQRSVGDGRADAEPAECAETVALCGYLPLAIRIAAAKLRHRPSWQVAHLAGKLREGHDRLAELTAEDRSVSSAFELSYRQLPTEQQRLFRLLGLLPGGDFDGYAAAALADRPLPEVGRDLDELVDANLLGEPRPGRFRFHDLMRAKALCAARSLETADAQRAALTRLFDFYLQATAAGANLLEPDRRAAGIQLGGPPSCPYPLADLGTALNWIDTEYRNLTSALDHATAHGWPTHAWQLAHALWRFLYRRDAIAEAIPLLAGPLRAAGAHGDRAGEATLLTDIGALHSRANQLADALDCLGRATELHQRLGDRHSEAVTMANLGYVHRELGHNSVALQYLQKAIAISRELGNRAAEGRMLNDAATYQTRLGDYPEALHSAELAMRINVEVGNDHGEGMSQQIVGDILSRLGRPDEARRYFALARTRYQQTGDRSGEAETLNSWGRAYRALGEAPAAIALHLQAVTVLTEIAGSGGGIQLINELGDAYRGAQQHDAARAEYSRALASAQSSDDLVQQTRALDGLASSLRPTDDQPE